MRAAIYEKYGPPEVIKIVELDKPKPKANEVLIKVYSSTVTSGDVKLRSSDFPTLLWFPARLFLGLFKPRNKVLGNEFSGIVVEKGADVTKFNAGDEVFGTTTMLKTGAYSEFICVPQEFKHGVIGLKPSNLDFKEAAALPIGAMTALFLLEKAKASDKKSILIYGASGSVGTYAIQLAEHFGLSVTGVCSSANIEMVQSLGAESVIDYKKDDYSCLEKKYDIVFDTVGKTTKANAKKVLNNGGVFISVKMLTTEKDEHLAKISELVEKNELRPFIDKYYPLSEIVAAQKYVDTGRKRGNVVITIMEKA